MSAAQNNFEKIHQELRKLTTEKKDGFGIC
jgi:hypothetical protein